MPAVFPASQRFLALLPLSAVLFLAAALALMDAPPARAHHLCGNTGSPHGPFSFQTYEHGDYRNNYARTFELAGFNQLLPDRAGFALPALEVGPRGAGSGQLQQPYIPPVLLKAIAWLESGWAQADYSVPYGQVGPVLSSHDCGYGIMQVTSGMQNVSGVPNLDQAMIGGHYAFNIARGARILAEKWNSAPEFRPVVGHRTPQVIEDWYYALWGYNGFAFKNHPMNPIYNPNRGPYRCDGTQPRSAFPYQELVIGCVNNPPWRGGAQLWSPQGASLPNLNDPAFSGPLNPANWDACAQQLQCAAMDMTTPSPWHGDPSGPSAPREQVIGSPTIVTSASSMSFVAQSGGRSADQHLTIGNTGSGLLSWRIRTTVPWIQVSHFQGVAPGADLGYRDHTIAVAADASSLYPGRHTGQIIVESMYANGSGRTVDVTIQIADGALFRIPDGTIYVLQGGIKRHIPDPPTFEASGYSLSQVVSVPTDWAVGIPTGHVIPSVLADGRLLKPPGDNAPVYVIDRGTKRHVTSPQVFAQCGYGWDSVRMVSATTIGSIPDGSPLSSEPCPRPTFANGTLLRGTDGRVWVVMANARRWVASAHVFADCGYHWGNLNNLGNGVNAQLPVNPELHGCTADGSLLWTPDGRVHTVRGGQLQPIPDGLTLELAGFRWADIAPAGQLGLGVGSPLPSLAVTGVLVRPPGDLAPVYTLEGGKKRYIVSADVFSGCGYRWSAVSVVSGQLLDAIPSGSALEGGPCPLISLPMGTLLQQRNGAVWVTLGSGRKWVSSPQAFIDCGYQPSRLLPAIDSVLATMGELSPVTGCRSDGSLLANSDGKIYLVGGGWKRHVPSPANVEGRGLSWAALTPAPDGWLPTGKPLLDVTATGRLVRPPGDNVPVYVMEAGKKRHISGPGAFASCGYGWDAVTTLSASTIASFPDGVLVTGSSCPKPAFPDGTLLQQSNGAVWVTHGNQRRWITDPGAFASCGYRWPDVDKMPDSILSALSQAANLGGPPCP
jgi:hypothetical protein